MQDRPTEKFDHLTTGMLTMKLLTNELEGKYPNFLDIQIIRVIENYPSRLSPLPLLLL